MSARNQAPWWVAASYLVYIILWEGLIFGGAGWAVFVGGHNGWWMLIALLIGSCAYQPHKWRRLCVADPDAEMRD
jgi:hypothetical protein